MAYEGTKAAPTVNFFIAAIEKILEGFLFGTGALIAIWLFRIIGILTV